MKTHNLPKLSIALLAMLLFTNVASAGPLEDVVDTASGAQDTVRGAIREGPVGGVGPVYLPGEIPPVGVIVQDGLNYASETQDYIRAPAQPTVSRGLDFSGSCKGTLSTKEYEVEVGGVGVDTPLVDIKILYATVTVSKTYYKVVCDVEATPWAHGSNGFIRTVWLEQNGQRVNSCSYTGLPNDDSCPHKVYGPTGTAGSTPIIGSFENGEGPSGADTCWVGPNIRASNAGYQDVGTVTSTTMVGDALCQTQGIDWVDSEGVSRPLEVLLADLGVELQ